MIDAKPENRKILYDMDNKILHYGEKYKKYFEDLNPLANELETYVVSCKEYDFDKANNKLKYNEVHATNINKIFEKYKILLNADNRNLKFYLLYYGYWLSKISCKYFELYFNEKITVNNYTKDIMFIHKKCTICNEDIYEDVRNRTDFNNVIKNKHYYYGINKDPFICNKCEEKNKKTQYQKEQEEKNKNITNLKSMPYKDYLQTDHWKTLRKRKLKQARYKCQICSSKEDLNVHHNTYENRGCEEDEDLVVLCKQCHEKFHNIKVNEENKQVDAIFHNDNISSTYNTKLFILNISNTDNEDVLNVFIKNQVNKVIDIKTNLFNDTYTILLMYI